jgi:hypothetical protein
MYNRVIVVLCALVLSPWLLRDDNRDAYGFISATVDSLKALGSMQLTREDSALVHLSDAQDREAWDILDDSMTIDLSPTSRKYSLRYVVAGNGEYGSYVILHRSSRGVNFPRSFGHQEKALYSWRRRPHGRAAQPEEVRPTIQA